MPFQGLFFIAMTEPLLDPVAVRLDIAVSNAKGIRRDVGELVRTVAQIRDEYQAQQAQPEEGTASEPDGH